MSTKNLSRTVIEGGRCGHYKSEVSTNARSERAEARAYLRKVTDDPDADLVQPKRQTVPACFADKTRPILRFLHARVGKHWDGVRSEVFQKFDARTTAGRHVLFDHLLSEVDDGSQGIPPSWRSFSRFFVDGDGVLRERTQRPRHLRHVNLTRWAVPAATWLRGRKIGSLGARYVWFESVRDADRVGVIWRGMEFAYVSLDPNGRVMYSERVRTASGYMMTAEPMVLRPRTIAFRQGSVLVGNDDAYFRSLPQFLRDKITKHAPVNHR